MPSGAVTVPPPGTQNELSLLVGIGKSISYFHTMSRSEQDESLKILEAYECLGQVVRLLDWRLQQSKSSDSSVLSDYLWMMRISYLGIEDFEKFVEVVVRAIRTLSLPFSIVRIHIAEAILGIENYHDQVKLFSRLEGVFTTRAQLIPMLERLALIYEKKLFLDEKVDDIYRKLLEVDANNVKALRYYKLLYMQSARYLEAAHQLERLIAVLPNPFEKQRAAHELAQICLYNLNDPARSREILETQCSGSLLDTHLTLMEALDRLGAYDDLIVLLQQVLLSTEDNDEKASLHLRISHILFKSGDFAGSVKSARLAVELMPQSFLAHEALLSTFMEMSDTSGVLETLEKLSSMVTLDSSKVELARLVQRGKSILARENGHA
jgi:tetratricopeptide (TPR) repeat protein